jgi:putative thiamine transport system ATP-binding protein
MSDTTIAIPPGTIHTLMGPSGCGKSTLLAAVCGTLDPQFELLGGVTLHGERVDHLPVQARRIGLLLQDDFLFPHLTVGENLLFAIPAGNREARMAVMRAALHEIELDGFERSAPSTLSGGQRSRVALARALLAKPQAILLDEPFSKLDVALRARLRTTVFETIKRANIPALLVTHDVGDIADPDCLTTLQTFI